VHFSYILLIIKRISYEDYNSMLNFSPIHFISFLLIHIDKTKFLYYIVNVFIFNKQLFRGITMDKDISYFDAITAININNGVVKLIMGNQDATVAADQQNKNLPVATKTIALPVNTFIYALAVFTNDPKNQDMIAKMQEAAGLNKSE